MNRECQKCQAEMLSAWNFCPECGTQRAIAVVLKDETPQAQPKELPQRFQELLEDYANLTGNRPEGIVREEFLANQTSSILSVIDRDRRIKAGKKCRINLGSNKYRLDLEIWLDTIYSNPDGSSVSRVWITSRGMKYHLGRDCRGIEDGQSYARARGKDTYNPQFVPIRRAAFILGLSPCSVCKPPKFTEEKS